MKRICMLSVLPFVMALACYGQTQQPTNPNPANAPKADSKTSQSKRVRSDLSGFELAPKHPSGDSVAQIGGASRGGGHPPFLYAPHLAKAYSANPTLFWGQPGTANEFILRVYDSNDNLIYETTVQGKNYTYPLAAPSLKPGETYSWSVEVTNTLMADPAEPVQFVLLSAAECKSLHDALDRIPVDGLQAQLQRAQIFEDARLWYDAIAAYSAAIATFPSEPDAYERRGEIYEQVPVTRELAQADMAHAEQLRNRSTRKE
jgi:hypothetical protein